MSTTTLMPLDPALSPQRLSRILTISADLLPDEVVAGRRARRSRGWVLATLVVVVLALASWYVYADHRVGLADDELSSITSEATKLQKGQGRYKEVVDTQIETTAISKQLKTLFANDLQWAALLDTVRSTGSDFGVKVSGITATLNAAAAGTAADTLPSSSGVASVGKLTIEGTAPDKISVAKYVDALGQLTTVTNPYLTTASESTVGVQFSVTADVASKALCGRFTVKCKSSGGN
jgi:hypothetical protein